MRFKRLNAAVRATKASLKKWERLSSGKFRGKEEPDCKLCNEVKKCDNCPVNFISGDGCEGTPYQYYGGATKPCGECPYNYEDGDGTCGDQGNTCPPPPFNRPIHVKEAKKELAFLKTILAGLVKMQDELKKVK